MYTKLRLDYTLRLWAFTSASRAIFVVAELLVNDNPSHYYCSTNTKRELWRYDILSCSTRLRLRSSSRIFGDANVAEKVVTYPNKKVDHEENVEGKIDLLSGTVRPFLARFDRLSERYRQTHRQTALLFMPLTLCNHIVSKAYAVDK